MRWGVVGGGIFAKTAKPPPLQSALHVALRPNIAHFSLIAMRILCTPHASHLWGPCGFYNDAARCVATNACPNAPINVRPHGLCSDVACRVAPPNAASLRSSKNLNCVIKPSLPVIRTSYKRLSPGPFAAVPFGIRRFKTYSPVSRRT